MAQHSTATVKPTTHRQIGRASGVARSPDPIFNRLLVPWSHQLQELGHLIEFFQFQNYLFRLHPLELLLALVQFEKGAEVSGKQPVTSVVTRGQNLQRHPSRIFSLSFPLDAKNDHPGVKASWVASASCLDFARVNKIAGQRATTVIKARGNGFTLLRFLFFRRGPGLIVRGN